MILKKTSLYCADNSGARLLRCINFLKLKSRNCIGYDSTHVVVTVKRFVPHKKVKKGNVYHGVIVQAAVCKQPYARLFGHRVWWSSNRVVLLKRNDTVPLGSRVTHFVSAKLRSNNFLRIISLALGVL